LSYAPTVDIAPMLVSYEVAAGTRVSLYGYDGDGIQTFDKINPILTTAEAMFISESNKT